jgi:hypothetical protein
LRREIGFPLDPIHHAGCPFRNREAGVVNAHG